MADLRSIRDQLKIRLETIPGLRVHDTLPDSLTPPAAEVVLGQPPVEYEQTFGGVGTAVTMWHFLVRLIVQRVSERTAQDTLDEYISTTGSNSVPVAIEGDKTLGGTVDTIRVLQAQNYGAYTVGDVSYLGVEFVVDAVTRA